MSEAAFYLSRLSLKAKKGVAPGYPMHQLLWKGLSNDTSGRFLWRLDRQGSRYICLVQSPQAPDWQALGDAAEQAEVKHVVLRFQEGQHLRFRLRANPTVKKQGKRYAIAGQEALLAWLQRKGEQGGFTPVSAIISGRHGLASHRHGTSVKQVGVDFDGVLRIVDPHTFAATMLSGIGSAKGFGFGLLSLAPPPATN